MSRSRRRPYSAIAGGDSANLDKTTARRNVRRKQNQWLKTLTDYDSALVPHKYECSWNDTYDWGRDGAQFLMLPSHSDWQTHQEVLQGLWKESRWTRGYATWPPRWFQQLKRK
jgi:hypothetical protein